MWRDILLIVGTILTVLVFFGLTGRRLSEYAKTEIIKRNRFQKAALFFMIALTLAFVSIVIWMHGTFELADFFLVTVVLFIAWYTMLSDTWKLSEKGKKILDVVKYSVFLPVWVASIVLSDMLLWQKIAFPLGGACIGVGIGVLRNYRRKKREVRRPSQEDKKDSPL